MCLFIRLSFRIFFSAILAVILHELGHLVSILGTDELDHVAVLVHHKLREVPRDLLCLSGGRVEELAVVP